MSIRHSLANAVRAARETSSILEAVDADALTSDSCLLLLAELGRREAELRDNVSSLAEKVGLPAAGKARLLSYLLLTKGKVVTKEELSGVSGIYEWARRLRELRLEEGWRISSDETRIELRPGQYMLEASEPSLELRERWQQANKIRRQPGSATERLATYFRAHIGEVVTADELFHVSRIHSFPRRIRELAEAGWDISSNLDRPALRAGEYVFSGRVVPRKPAT